ncbi:phospholipase D-like domain-containing protein DpdK [Polyangium sp. 6x1]|uniref:phospholipase D-like domain-containing protein DpdK n=1 Tax=Polyangium sp. 6x1 TaxID=3042689 RepID=UPI0024821F88|nr:phospholipase D-like domain-containing protein DpdK [Polyangium sp. 6x1]MDI1450822.1 phospholipase D-like domain-containing protein DpdK [Polyangium sp. 6x1]
MNARVLQKSRDRARNEARELLQFFFASELIRPSKCLWIVSPWLRNIELFDSTTGAFAALVPDTPKRVLRLTDVLRAVLLAGTRLVVVLRTPRDDGGVCDELTRIATTLNCLAQLSIVESHTLHTKGLLGDRAAVTGSMNVTYAGVDVHTELLQFVTDPELVATLRLEFSGTYGR